MGPVCNNDGQEYKVWETPLVGKIVGFKCEWLSPTLTKNELNVGYIIDVAQYSLS